MQSNQLYLQTVTLTAYQVSNLKLTSSYAIHCWVYNTLDTQQRHFLYTWESVGEALKITLISTVAFTAPYLTATVDITSWWVGLEEKSKVHVSLIVNPTHTVEGKRHPILYKSVPAWLQAQALKHGFTVTKQRIEGPYRYEYVRKARREHHIAYKLTLQIQVTNLVLFKEAMLTGLGSAKGFGYGMLNPILPGQNV